MQIPILGLGDIPVDVLKKLEDMLNGEFSKIRIYAKGVREIPEDTFNSFRDQYMAEGIMDEFHKEGIQILVTEEDIYTKGKNYVFGEAEYRGPALVSTHRLDPTFYDKERNEDLLFKRLKKVLIHELGHCFGLDECDDPLCVMHYTGSAKSVDDKECEFCNDCQVKISTEGLPLG